MKERIGIRFCCAFIYVLICVVNVIPEHGHRVVFELLPYYFTITCLMTLILECWYYIMIDLLKYFKYVTLALILISLIWLYLDFSYYLCCGLVYLVFVMMKDYYLAYSMSKLVYDFNQKDDFQKDDF